MENDFQDYFEFYTQNILRNSKRYVRDVSNPLEVYSDEQFRKRFRFSKSTVVDTLVPMVDKGPMSKRGLPISPLLKVLVALRFYATSSFQIVCADLYDISQSSVCRIIGEVSETFARYISKYIKLPAEPPVLNNLKLQFYRKAGFPGVVGVIDGTHIPIKSPGGPNAEIFRNRKAYFSINVQIVGGPNEEILDIVVSWPGSAHDSRIFENSAVRVRLSEGQVAGHLLGDSGYATKKYIYTPVQNPRNRSEQNYNRALKATRSSVERLIGRWKRRFPCLYFEMQNKVKNITRIITACAVLYNIGIEIGDLWNLDEGDVERNIIEVETSAVPENANSNVIKQAFIQRYFNN